ncbi:MAG: hypothetical protein C5B49_05125 [Bdellovibrio sp.]|nr:MAG: hypothetical protein C5B49_05125 [Bdellovibrio sp.]
MIPRIRQIALAGIIFGIGIATSASTADALSVEFPGLESVSFRFDEQQDLIVLNNKNYFVTLYNTNLRIPQLSAYLLTANHLKVGAAAPSRF